MHAAAIDLPAWSALLAGLAYTALAFHVLRSGGLTRAHGRSSLLFAGAVLASAAWGWAGVLLRFDLAPNAAVGIPFIVAYELPKTVEQPTAVPQTASSPVR